MSKMVIGWNDFYQPPKEYVDYIDERNKNLESNLVYVTYTNDVDLKKEETNNGAIKKS